MSRVNAQKAAGLDVIPGHVFRAWAEQLAGGFISNLSMAQAVVPTSFKTATLALSVLSHSPPSLRGALTDWFLHT